MTVQAESTKRSLARRKPMHRRPDRSKKHSERYNVPSTTHGETLCRHLRMGIPSWKPDFYPAKLAQTKFLQHYSTQLNAVEVNFTFRQLLKETTAQKWIAETPTGFRFSVKAHQVITHIKRFKKTEDFMPRFLGTIEPLARAEKLGPVLFQLPPNLKVDAKLLEEFLTVLPRGVPSAFEFRHESWFTDEIFDLLKGRNLALCVAESEERTTPDVVTADFCYYRYRKPVLLAGRTPRHDRPDS